MKKLSNISKLAQTQIPPTVDEVTYPESTFDGAPLYSVIHSSSYSYFDVLQIQLIDINGKIRYSFEDNCINIINTNMQKAIEQLPAGNYYLSFDNDMIKAHSIPFVKK